MTGTVTVVGGWAGLNAQPSSGATITPGGGGGGCGGTGGNAGGTIPSTTTVVNASAGTAGYFLQTVAPEPESLLGL